MSGRPQIFNTNAVTASPAAATETVIATLGGVMVSFPSNVCTLQGFADITLQAAVTDITLRVRRTGIAGTIVATAKVTPKAAADFARATYSVVGNDTPGDVANFTYVLTAELTAGASPSTVNAVGLTALVGA